MTDSSSLISILSKTKPDEIYNLAAQSHVQVSFEIPEYTANSDAIGVLRLLEAVRSANLIKKNKSLSSIYLRIIWKGSGSSTKRENSFLSKKPLCRCKTIRILDYYKL